METKPKIRTYGTDDILQSVKSGKPLEAQFHAANVQRLLVSGDKTYAEYIPHMAEINKQLRAKSKLVRLSDDHYLSRKEAENMRRFFKTWEQLRRDYERILAAYRERFEEKP